MQKIKDNKNIIVDFFATEWNLGKKYINIETTSIEIITYPKITFVKAKNVIETEDSIIYLKDMDFCLKFLINTKHTRLIKNQEKDSVRINGSIWKIGKYKPRNIVKNRACFLEE